MGGQQRTAETENEAIDPREQLFGFLAALRGGYRVTESLVLYDYMEWVAIHGDPTRESVDRWIEGNWELEFAIRVMAQREIDTKGE